MPFSPLEASAASLSTSSKCQQCCLGCGNRSRLPCCGSLELRSGLKRLGARFVRCLHGLFLRDSASFSNIGLLTRSVRSDLIRFTKCRPAGITREIRLLEWSFLGLALARSEFGWPVALPRRALPWRASCRVASTSNFSCLSSRSSPSIKILFA